MIYGTGHRIEYTEVGDVRTLGNVKILTLPSGKELNR